MKKCQPLILFFTAVADLGTSVSDLNQSSRNLVTRVGSLGRTTAKATVAGKVGQAASKYFSKRKSSTESETTKA